jgi:hypothetical protein
MFFACVLTSSGSESRYSSFGGPVLKMEAVCSSTSLLHVFVFVPYLMETFRFHTFRDETSRLRQISYTRSLQIRSTHEARLFVKTPYNLLPSNRALLPPFLPRTVLFSARFCNKVPPSLPPSRPRPEVSNFIRPVV